MVCEKDPWIAIALHDVDVDDDIPFSPVLILGPDNPNDA